MFHIKLMVVVTLTTLKQIFFLTIRNYPFISSLIRLPFYWNIQIDVHFSLVHSLSHVRLFATPQTAKHRASLPLTNSWSLLKLMSFESVMPSNHLILCHPLLLLPSIFPTSGSFSMSVLHIRWPKYWSFSFSNSLFNAHSGLIFFRTDWFDFLAVRGTLKSLLKHHSSKASILPQSAFFMV